MPLDPLTCIGLAGNIVQFLDFSVKIVLEGYQIYNSATGSTKRDEEAEFVASDFLSATERIADSLSPPGTDIVLNKHEQKLENLRIRCAAIAKELLEKLNKLNLKGKKTILKSLGKALRKAWSASEINDLQKRLENLRDELELEILVDIKSNVDLFSLQQMEGFEKLELRIQALVTALSENHTKITEIMEIQSRRMEEIQHHTEGHITKEHTQTRNHITGIQQELVRHNEEIGVKNSELSIKIQENIVTTREDLMAHGALEHEKTREMLRSEIEERDRALRARLDEFMKDWDAKSKAEQEKFKELRKADFAALKAKRIVLDDLESSSPTKAGSLRLEPYPDPIVPLPARPRSTEVPRHVAKQRGQSRGTADLRTHSREVDRSRSYNIPDPRNSQQPPALLVPPAPPRPRSASAISTVAVPLHILRPALFVLIRTSSREPLVSLDVTDCDSDVHFFLMMRRVIPSTGFERTLEFAEFYLDDLMHIRVLGTGKAANPPGDHDQAWEYAPRPMRIVPPVGMEALTDYFRNPRALGESGYSREVLQKLPKTRLSVQQLLGEEKRVVWGLNLSSSWRPSLF